MPPIRQVAVVLENQLEHGRSIIRGVANYARRGRHWQLHAPPLGRNYSTILKAATGADGVITWPHGEKLAAVVRDARVPTVAVNDRGDLPIPVVRSNPDKTVAMAIDHFVRQGFRHFAFFGPPAKQFSIERRQAFQRALAQKGIRAPAFSGGSTHDTEFAWNRSSESLLRWLRGLPRPVAVLAANDWAGHELLRGALRAGVRVPDDMAVVGVDNDELICQFTVPPLSSIDIAGERIGFEAAALLDRLMNGERVGDKRILVDPHRLVVRQSSDVLAVSDPTVAAAVRYIRENTSANLNVETVLQEVPIARRTLEVAFRKTLGRSSHEEIVESRVRLARQLLTETDMTIPDVSESCGFSNRSRLSKVFAQLTGYSPAAFRRKFRKPR